MEVPRQIATSSDTFPTSGVGEEALNGSRVVGLQIKANRAKIVRGLWRNNAFKVKEPCNHHVRSD